MRVITLSIMNLLLILSMLNGEVTIGNESFLGSGAVTKESISIGNNCVIGAGITLKSDIQSYQTINN